MPKDTVFFGEISLSGDVRPAPQAELRLKEAAKLGFKTALVPAGTRVEGRGVALTEVKDVAELLALGGPREVSARPAAVRGRIKS